MSATSFFPPMTNGHATTSWIPLTTTWPDVSGNGASAIWYDGSEYSAWLPDDHYHSFGSANLPPEVTQLWNMQNWEASISNMNYGFAPFSGCPTPFTNAATATGELNGTATVCCPPYFDVYTPNGVFSAACTSTFRDPVLSFLQGSTYVTSWVPKGETTTSSTDFWLQWSTTTSGLPTQPVITAPPIMGWNFPASQAAVVGAAVAGNSINSGAGTATDTVSSGFKSATIALAVIAGVTILLAAVLVRMYLALRKRLANMRTLDGDGSGVDKSAAASSAPAVSPVPPMPTVSPPPDAYNTQPAPGWRQEYAPVPAQELQAGHQSELPADER